MSRSVRRAKAILAFCAVAAIGVFIALGGFYGVQALLFGHNPFRLAAPSGDRIPRSHAAALTIVAAIELYHTRHGAYPPRLEDLVPEFLAYVPQPTAGPRQWEYTLDPQKGFILGYFIGPKYEKEWYEGIPGEWKADM
jgi:hypothetical protein